MFYHTKQLRSADEGSILEVDPYPGTSAGQPIASQALEQLRAAEDEERS